MSKTRILFVAEDVTLAHSARAYVLASHIDSKRYEIHFATSPRSRFLISAPSISYHEIETLDPKVFIKRLKKGQPVYSTEELSRSTDEDIMLLDKVRPDVVVGDFRLSLGISCDLTGTPYISLTNAHWSPYSTQAFPLPDHSLIRFVGLKVARLFFQILQPVIFWHHARAFNRVRRTHGLPAVGNLKEVYTHSDWSLFADIPTVAPTAKLTENQRYIGPVIWSPEIDLPDWWTSLSFTKPLIYVTMGSSGDVALMDNILKALRSMSCTAIIATAGRIQVDRESNIYAAEYLPGLEAIKKSSLVICSGGSATAYQALSLGVPVLGVPSNADQFFTMESINKNGAGVLLRPSEVSLEKLRKTINTLIREDDSRAHAKALSLEISRYDSTQLFPAFLDEFCLEYNRQADV